MQTITNLALLLFLSLVLLTASPPVAPQDVVDAFSKSYAHENVKAYDKAIQAFEQEYDAGSYPMNLRIGW